MEPFRPCCPVQAAAAKVEPSPPSASKRKRSARHNASPMMQVTFVHPAGFRSIGSLKRFDSRFALLPEAAARRLQARANSIGEQLADGMPCLASGLHLWACVHAGRLKVDTKRWLNIDMYGDPLGPNNTGNEEGQVRGPRRRCWGRRCGPVVALWGSHAPLTGTCDRERMRCETAALWQP